MTEESFPPIHLVRFKNKTDAVLGVDALRFEVRDNLLLHAPQDTPRLPAKHVVQLTIVTPANPPQPLNKVEFQPDAEADLHCQVYWQLPANPPQMLSVFWGEFVLLLGQDEVRRSEPALVLCESRPDVLDKVLRSRIAVSTQGAEMLNWLQNSKGHRSDPVKRLQRGLGDPEGSI